MNRERLVGYALPASDRPERGPELAGTIADAGATSTLRCGRELAHLVRFGLNTRARQVASAGIGRVLADAVCRGTTWIMVLDLSTLLVWRLSADRPNPLADAWSIGLLGAVLALALLGFERAAGTGGLLWVVLRAPQLAAVTTPGQWLPPAILLAACFGVMVLAPRRRPVDPRRLGWLLVPAWLIATFVLGDRANGYVFLELLVVVLLVVAAALVSLPTDPRLAVAGVMPVTYLGLSFERGDNLLPAVVVFLLVPLTVVALAALRIRQLKIGSLRS